MWQKLKTTPNHSWISSVLRIIRNKYNWKYSNDNLSKLKILVNNIQDNLVSSVEASSFPSNTKIPFKTLSLRESLLHRISDLSLTAYDLFYKKNALSGIIITRSILETVSILYSLNDKIEKTIESKDLVSFHEYLLRLMLGSKNKSSDIEAINVLSSIDIWAKENNKIRKLYDDLSEFAHPNWWGNLGIMGNIDRKNYTVNFGKESPKWESALKLGIISALIVLQSSEDIYDKMADVLPKFLELCELKNM